MWQREIEASELSIRTFSSPSVTTQPALEENLIIIYATRVKKHSGGLIRSSDFMILIPTNSIIGEVNYFEVNNSLFQKIDGSLNQTNSIKKEVKGCQTI